MSQIASNYPTEAYTEGLIHGDEALLRALYAEFRYPTIRAVTAQGGTEADGSVFFFTAVMEAAHQARNGGIPAEISMGAYLQTLALAHYNDWLQERGQAVSTFQPETATEPDPLSHLVPDSQQLRNTRYQLIAWRAFAQLSPDCKNLLSTLPAPDPAMAGLLPPPPPHQQNCLNNYRAALRVSEPGLLVPDWALAAARDQNGFAFRQKLQQVESSFAAGHVTAAQQRSSKKVTWIVVGIFALLLAGTGVAYLMRDKKPVEVYKDNFAPPESIMADMKQRYGAGMGNDSVTTHPSLCLQKLEEADEYYKTKDYSTATAMLSELAEGEHQLCRSDAYFYMAVMGLQLDDPQYTLSCLAKIEDLESFGQDIYWYQALAFVKMAQTNPGMKEKATRAVERALGNMTDPDKKAQVEKMLQQMGGTTEPQ